MLNPFPTQFLALFAYLLLRVVTGLVLAHLGLKHWRYRAHLAETFTLSWWPYGRLSVILLVLSELVAAVMFLLGFYTQVAALLTMAMALKLALLRGLFLHPSLPSRLFYVLLFGVALSLFITGAGSLAFDLPI